MEEKNFNQEENKETVDLDLEKKINDLEQELIYDLKESTDSLVRLAVLGLLGPSWSNKLESEFAKDYMIKLGQYIQRERQIHKVYPEKEHVFDLFKLCKFEDVKVVVLIDEPIESSLIMTKQMNDLLTSVELACYDGFKLDFDHSLNNWYSQGIFVLPRVLTSVHNKPGAHVGKGWEEFTDAVISKFKEKDIVILDADNISTKDIFQATIYVDKKYNIKLK